MSRSQEKSSRVRDQVRLVLSPILLSLAIGALLWQVWASRHRVDATEVTLAGKKAAVRLPMTTQDRDQLVAHWMVSSSPPVDAKFAVMRWRHEVAAIYAERLSANDVSTDSPFRLASTVSSASERATIAEPSGPTAAWRTYWNRQRDGTGEQLERREDRHRAHLEAVADRLLIAGQLWGQTPRPTLAWIAGLSMGLGGLWWWGSRRVDARTRGTSVCIGTPEGPVMNTAKGWFRVAAPAWYRVTETLVWMLIGGTALALLPNLPC